MVKIRYLTVISLIVSLLFNVYSVSSTIIETGNSSTIYVDDDGTADYEHIQDAIDNASEGDTVFVKNGTYYEHHIIIGKKIYLIGEDKNATIINAVGKFIGVQIHHDEVLLKGFTIRNTSYTGPPEYDWWDNSLVEIKNSTNVVVENNIFINDYYNPNKDTLVCGICILDSTDCFLRNNIFYGCNILTYYLKNFNTDKSNKKYFFHNINSSNKVNGKPVYYYKNCENIIVPSNAGQVIFANTNNSIISGIENDNTTFNVQLFFSNDNTIINNKLNDSLSGFWLYYSDYNVFKNNIVNRTACSLFLWHSNYNFFENNILPSSTIEQYSDHNNFIKNHFRSSRSCKFSIQLECSDYNLFKCNNIHGYNLIYAKIIDNVTAVRLFNSHHIIWNQNYWANNLREKHKILANQFPKLIVGFCRGFYGPLPWINFPSYVNVDWHPVDKPYYINTD